MTIRRANLLFALLATLVGLNTPAMADPLPIKSAETSATIAISGAASADAKIKRSFRLELMRAAPLRLHFVAPVLTDKYERRIDQSQVRLPPDGPLGTDPADFMIEVNGPIRPGSYDGTIEVRSPDIPNGLLRLPIHLDAAAPTTVSLSKDTPRIAIKHARSCDPLTTALLTSLQCRLRYDYSLSGTLPSDIPAPDMLLVDSEGVALPPANATATVSGTRLTISIGDAAFWPGHYAGRVRLSSNTWDAPVDVPVDLQVRTTAFFPILAIILGILAGRVQSYMTTKGDALLAAAARLREVMARAATLDPAAIDAIDAVAGPIWSAIKIGDSARAVALLTPLETNVGILENVKALEASVAFDAAANTLDGQIIASTRIGDATAAQASFGLLKTQVAQLIAEANAAGGAGGPAPDPANTGGIRDTFASGLLYITGIVRPMMQILLVVVIAFSGIKLLYIDGSPTLGAQPLADFLALFAWGLTADVAGRTFANFRGATS